MRGANFPTGLAFPNGALREADASVEAKSGAVLLALWDSESGDGANLRAACDGGVRSIWKVERTATPSTR